MNAFEYLLERGLALPRSFGQIESALEAQFCRPWKSKHWESVFLTLSHWHNIWVGIISSSSLWMAVSVYRISTPCDLVLSVSGNCSVSPHQSSIMLASYCWWNMNGNKKRRGQTGSRGSPSLVMWPGTATAASVLPWKPILDEWLPGTDMGI